MVRGAAAAARPLDDPGLTRPTAWSIFRRGLPGFLREGALPVAAFYAGLELGGLAAGIAASTLVSVLLYAYERRAGREGLLVRLSLLFVAVQGLIGLVSGSAVVYLATPVVATAAWGVLFLASAAVGRPLAGALACAWYPFTPEFRRSDLFRRVYAVESVVWGAYLLARSALRLVVLLEGSLGGYVVVVFLTGTPAMLALLAWSVWYAIRRFAG